jgi:hypothetical protein
MVVAWLTLVVGGCVNLEPPELSMTRDSGSPRYRTDGGAVSVGGPAIDPVTIDAAVEGEDSGSVAPDGPLPDVGGAEAEPTDGPPAPLDAPPAGESADSAPPLADTAVPPPDPSLPPDASPGPPPPDAAPPADTAPDTGSPELLIDDFERAAISLGSDNPLGGIVDWDNQNVSIVGGQLRFQWSGSGGFQDFIETLSGSYCPRDLRAFRKLRFRMRASAAGKRVPIHAKTSTAACDVTATPVLATITVGTAMTTFEVDLAALNRAAASAFEWSPPVDSTVYFLDDVQLVP